MARVANTRAAALALFVSIAGCGSSRPNVVLISIDTLRADHCSAYGYDRPTTPAMAALAREGARFRFAYAPMPTTGPSHATMLTGLYPITHGVTRNGAVLAGGFSTLTERLAAQNYQTAAFVSSYVLDPRFGFGQGFDTYDARFSREGSTTGDRRHAADEGFDRRASATTLRVAHWLANERERSRPFFLFVHYFDPHFPYSAPGLHRDRFVTAGRSKRVAQYDGEIAFTDRSVGTLLKLIKNARLAENTLVIVTADHGEGLGQHDSEAHDIVIYEEAVRVPLVFRWPGKIRAGRALLAPVELVDLAPTVLDLVGVSHDGASFAGRSLAGALVRGEKLDLERPVFLHRRLQSGTTIGKREVGGEEFGVRVGQWKLIENVSTGSVELFNLHKDPGELRNLARMGPKKTDELAANIDRFLTTHGNADAGHAPHRLEPEVRERLRALGYVD